MSEFMQIKQLVADNVLVNYYVVSGEQKASAVLFLHGWGADGAMWLPVMHELAGKGLASYSIDFPGFGKSQKPPQAFSVDDYVRVVGEVIKKFGLASVYVVAHSFGGRVAIKLAADHPELVKKLVLVDSAGVRVVTKKLSLKQGIVRVIKPFLRLRLLHLLRPYLYRLFASEDYLAYPELRETFVKIVNEDLTPVLQRISVETLLVWGEKDVDTPLDGAEIIKKNIPHSRLVVLKNAGHFSFLDNKQEFSRVISEFLMQ